LFGARLALDLPGLEQGHPAASRSAESGSGPGDAFEVIVPSLARFSFSTPLTSGKENYVSMAIPSIR
jgi:hypothetical protein